MICSNYTFIPFKKFYIKLFIKCWCILNFRYKNYIYFVYETFWNDFHPFENINLDFTIVFFCTYLRFVSVDLYCTVKCFRNSNYAHADKFAKFVFILIYYFKRRVLLLDFNTFFISWNLFYFLLFYETVIHHICFIH